MRILLLVTAILSFSVGNAQKKLSPQKLNEDLEYLIAELLLQHQGLYEYLSENQTKAQIDSIRNTLQTPMTKLEFYRKLSYVIGLTNEGHTAINLPKRTMRKWGLSKSFLPLTVRLCDNQVIISQNYGEPMNEIKKGSKIIAVNHRKVSEILDEVYPYIVTDGFNETSKQEWVGGVNFSLLYRLVFGEAEQFELQIQDYGNDSVRALTIPAIRITGFNTKNAKLASQSFDYYRFGFEQINDSIAYLSIPSFGKDDLDYEEFYRSNFRKIDSLNIQHLIIDIQANGGGTEGNENLLFSYLSGQVIQKYKHVSMLAKPYQKNKKDPDYIEDEWKLEDSVAQRGTYTLYSDYYSDLGYEKPPQELVYPGKVYVLISGRTFSGGAEFASLVKMTDRGLFIGEETGGTYEGNVSGYSESIKLPNSKIEVEIPTVHFQMNVSPEQKGRGVIPDYEVPQTWEDFISGRNTKKDFTIKMITQ